MFSTWKEDTVSKGHFINGIKLGFYCCESSEQAFEFKQRQSQNPIPEGKLGGGEKQNYPCSRP